MFVLTLLCLLGSPPAETPPGDLAERYQPQSRKIIDAALAQNDAWRKMEELCDGIGHRLSGSPALERAVQWAQETMKREGHENVAAEPVKVPHWERGEESLRLVAPYEESMPLLGLGGSVPTPPDGIIADVLVVKDQAELDTAGEAARGRIVLFNFPMPAYSPETGSGYGATVVYRGRGASWAARHGAVACLVRSVTARSLRSAHTGAMRYLDEVPERIPAAAITIEDAERLARLQARGVTPRVHLKMGCRDHGLADSANVLAELRGSERPNEIVVISGHLDSWDVGTGAHDDAGGCVIAMEALNVLRKLGLRPRRTIRVVLWTNEENGLAGAKAYVAAHSAELRLHAAAIESDSGIFAPRGYSFELIARPQAQDTAPAAIDQPKDSETEKLNQAHEARALQQLQQIARLLEPLGANSARLGGSGADIGQMKSAAVPLLGHEVDGSIYFDYHHSHADTLDKVDPKHLSQNVAMMAVMAYVLADMPGRLGDPAWDPAH